MVGLLDSFQWIDILVKIGMDIPIDKDKFTIRCPFHNDRRPSFYVNLEYDFWTCYSYPDVCGKGNLVELVAKFLGISLLGAERIVYDYTMDWDNIELLPDIDYIKKDVKIEPLPIIEIKYDRSFVPDWILDRGFSKNTLVKWKCGMLGSSLIIPILDLDQRQIGWIKRQMTKKPKYIFPEGLLKNRLLFGLNNVVESRKLQGNNDNCVLITEGPLDTMWLDQFGYISVSLLGLTLSSIQEKILIKLGVDEICLCLDNDSPGNLATDNISKRLIKMFNVSFINLPSEVKDIQDVRDEYKLRSLVENRGII